MVMSFATIKPEFDRYTVNGLLIVPGSTTMGDC